METINKSEFENVEIVRHEDHYIVRNNGTYFKMGIPEGELFEALYSGTGEQTIEAQYSISAEQLNQFVEILRSRHIIGKPEKSKNSIFFYKIPLFEGDKFMQKAAEFVRQYQAVFYALLCMAALCVVTGCVFFCMDFRLIFSLQSIKLPIPEYVLLYAILLVTVALHEISHGLVCRLMGCRVGKMGIMLIFFSPALYCDISGIRMQSSRLKQVVTSAAGLLFNLFMAGIAAIIFHFTQIPFWATFVILNLTIIYSNLLPLIKLDGYWILSFTTGITNLYVKSIRGIPLVIKGKKLRERLLGLYGICTVTFAALNVIAFIYGIVEAVYSFVIRL